jgi:hypothetical protein
MSATELRKAEAAYRAAFGRSEAKREARNEAVRRAVASGMPQVEVARITGLGKARIGQIVHDSNGQKGGDA